MTVCENLVLRLVDVTTFKSKFEKYPMPWRGVDSAVLYQRRPGVYARPNQSVGYHYQHDFSGAHVLSLQAVAKETCVIFEKRKIFKVRPEELRIPLVLDTRQLLLPDHRRFKSYPVKVVRSSLTVAITGRIHE